MLGKEHCKGSSCKVNTGFKCKNAEFGDKEGLEQLLLNHGPAMGLNFSLMTLARAPHVFWLPI